MATTNREWRKSSRSGQNGEVCVEVATDSPGVRDSKQTDGPVLEFSTTAWAAFTGRIKRNELDLA